MSEYQYYEFRKVDGRLKQKEMDALRRVSTRGEITPTSYTNEYNWGDFKGSPDAWMEKYFDGFLYYANWGTHLLQLAVPAKLLSLKTARRYCSSEMASAREKAGKVILDFGSEDEEAVYEWYDESEGELLTTLLPLRMDLIRGDLRMLYLGWLLNAQFGELEDDEIEPPVPPNLGHLSEPLKAFADFLRIDRHLIEAAAEASDDTEGSPVEQEDKAAWIASLPAGEKDTLLMRALSGEDAAVGLELAAKFSHREAARSSKAEEDDEQSRRTVGELMSTAKAREEHWRREEARNAAEAKARQARAAEVARKRRMDAIAGHEPETWAKVEELITSKQPSNYKLAIQHLKDLRDLSEREGGKSPGAILPPPTSQHQTEFRRAIVALKARHATKSSLLRQLREALL